MRYRVLKSTVMLYAVLSVAPVPSHAQTEAVKLKGDMRIRYESIDQEKSDVRNLARLRARVGLTAKVSNTVNVVFGLATGDVNSPITSNQALTGGFSDKPFWIDTAFFDWTAAGAHVFGGKMKNPFYSAGRTQLLWDNDLNPEGFGITYAQKTEALGIFANGAFIWNEERAAGRESFTAGAQAGFDLSGKLGNLRIGAGYYDYINTRGFPTFYDSTKSAGNSVDALKHYLFDFRVVELFGEYGLPRVPASPSLYVEYVANIAKDVKDNQGWQVGASAGKLAKPGSWTVRYFYQKLERNAVIGAFSNSDYVGGTDNKGHALSGEYQISGQISAGLTYYQAQKGIINGLDYRRCQADMNFRF